jgi:hypothetical protein
LLKGQSGLPEVRGAKSAGLGGLGICLQEPDGYLSNSSALGYLHQTSFSAHALSRFTGTGIRAGSIQAILPSGTHAAYGLNMEWYGLPEYFRQLIRVGYGRALSPGLAMGLSFHYLGLHVSQVEPIRNLGFDLGFMIKINGDLGIGWSSYHPIPLGEGSPVSSPGANLAGLSYKISEGVVLYAEWEKTGNRPWKSHLALDYQVVPVLSMRMGVTANPAGLGAGIGLQADPRLAIDISFDFHPVLGISPALSLRYIFVPKENGTD